MKITKKSIVSNLFWKFSERTGIQIVSFAVTVVLARLLPPSDFGLVAMVVVFVMLANSLIVNGFGYALIQKNDVDNLDYSSVFYAGILMSIIFYGAIYFFAPIIADFYGYSILTPVLRVLGVRVFFDSIYSVQSAFIAKNMIFKKVFYSSIFGTAVSAIIGISMAYNGYGVWALIIQQISYSFINTVVIWFSIAWKPQLIFSLSRIKQLFSFGWKLQIASILNSISTQARHLIIGKIYSPSSLAYYDRGSKLPSIFMVNINAAFNSVLFPVITSVQNDSSALHGLTRRSIRVSSFVLFPMLVGLAVTAEPLVNILLTEKWIDSVPYIRIGCFVHAVTIMQIAIQNAILAKGKSDIFLSMDIVSKVIGFALLFALMNEGVMIIALLGVVMGAFNVLMKAWVSKRMIGYKYREHFEDNIPAIAVSSVMGIAVYLINLLNLSSGITLSIQIPLGVSIYLLVSYIFRMEGLFISINLVSSVFGRTK